MKEKDLPLFLEMAGGGDRRKPANARASQGRYFRDEPACIQESLVACPDDIRGKVELMAAH